jgi:hypothetical protein
MFEPTSRLAERLAASVSRRGFLGSLGAWAAAAALGVAGMLTGVGTARADKKSYKCCYYPAGFCTTYTCVAAGQPCPATCCGLPFGYSARPETSCKVCASMRGSVECGPPTPCPFPC